MAGGSFALDRCLTLVDRIAPARLELAEYAGTVLAALKRAVGFDGWCLEIADPVSGLPMTAEIDNAPLGDRLPDFWRFQFPAGDLPEDLWTHAQPVSLAASRRDPGGVRRFHELLRPGGVADELRGVLVADGLVWGELGLFRSQGASPFTEQDRAAIAGILPRLATGAREAWALGPAVVAGVHVPEPGTLLLDSDGELISETAAARRWLAQLPAGYSTLTALVARLQSTTTAALRTRTTSGIWLRLSGSRLVPSVGRASMAITLQPATPAEIIPLLLHAFGMTPRQRAVAHLVVAGRSTDQIARALHVSSYTVNDHVKAIAAKAGVHSRGELVARLSGLPAGESLSLNAGNRTLEHAGEP